MTAAWLACLDHDAACEEAAGALIRGFLAAGRPEQAARVFERCRAALEESACRISPSLERVYTSAVAARTTVPAAPQALQGRLPSPGTPAPQRPSAHWYSQHSHQDPGRPAAPGLPGPARQPREERRPVTVLFAEAAAPTGLAGTLGLEELRDLVGGSLASVIAEVEALGGTVSSVSGRGLQAMFGAPEAHEQIIPSARCGRPTGPWPRLRGLRRRLRGPRAGRYRPGRYRPARTVPAGQGASARPGLRIGIESGPAWSARSAAAPRSSTRRLVTW